MNIDLFETMQLAALYIHYGTPPILFWMISACILLILVHKKYWHEGIVFVVSLVLTTASVGVLKLIFEFERPTGALIPLTSYSFPSGHAAASMFLAIMGTLLISRQPTLASHKALVTAAILFLIALIIGFSRILIGVHTFAEVVAGFALGAGIPLLVTYLSRHLKQL